MILALSADRVYQLCAAAFASVAVVASKRGGGSLLAKFKIQNLAAGSGQILNFEFCGVGSQSVAVVASVVVASRRVASVVVASRRVGRRRFII